MNETALSQLLSMDDSETVTVGELRNAIAASRSEKVASYVTKIINHGRLTVVEIDAVTPAGGVMRFVGTARRAPGDKTNRKLGNNIAYSRAMSAAAKTIAKQAQGLVKHNDDVAAAQAAYVRLTKDEIKAKRKAEYEAKQSAKATAEPTGPKHLKVVKVRTTRRVAKAKN